LDFAVPCPNSGCGVLWKITELCLVSFDHLLTMCKFGDDFPYDWEMKNSSAKKRKLNDGSAVVTITPKINPPKRKIPNGQPQMTTTTTTTTPTPVPNVYHISTEYSEPPTPGNRPSTPNGSSASKPFLKIKQRLHHQLTNKKSTPSSFQPLSPQTPSQTPSQTQLQPLPSPLPSSSSSHSEQIFNFGITSDDTDSLEQIDHEFKVFHQMNPSDVIPFDTNLFGSPLQSDSVLNGEHSYGTLPW